MQFRVFFPQAKRSPPSEDDEPPLRFLTLDFRLLVNAFLRQPGLIGLQGFLQGLDSCACRCSGEGFRASLLCRQLRTLDRDSLQLLTALESRLADLGI